MSTKQERRSPAKPMASQHGGNRSPSTFTLRSPATLSLIACAIALALVAIGIWLAFVLQANEDSISPRVTAPDHYGEEVLFSALVPIGVLPLIGMGALLVGRQPGNLVGPLLLLSGLAWSLSSIAELYAGVTLHWSMLPGGAWGAWLSAWLWTLGLLPLLVIIPLLFPTGRPPSRRWRPFVWASFMLLVIAGLGEALSPVTLDVYLSPRNTANPVVIPGITSVLDGLGLVEMALYPVVILGAIGALGWRLLRAQGIERQQVKWFVFVASVIVGLFSVATIVESISGTTGIAGAFVGASWITIVVLVAAGVPVVIALAILRYQLYEIDRLINRALVYGLLTALLVGAYVVLVVLLQAVLEPLTSGSDLAVAGSTLVVAALFRPVRARVQNEVDRRFYRRRYDAARTVDAFAARLRDEIDLDVLTGELRAVVQETVQPAYVSLWLRLPRGQP